MSILDANGAMACAECGRQARAVRDRLKAENARLREERREYQATIDSLVDECADLKAENAKLRKIAKECHELLQNLLAGCSLHPFTVEVMEQRMRELGIEVSE